MAGDMDSSVTEQPEISDVLQDRRDKLGRIRDAGRIAARRGHGKNAFIDIRDGSGQIQLHAREDVLGAEAYALLVDLDIGDIVGVEGTAMANRRGGELSLALDHW